MNGKLKDANRRIDKIMIEIKYDENRDYNMTSEEIEKELEEYMNETDYQNNDELERTYKEKSKEDENK